MTYRTISAYVSSPETMDETLGYAVRLAARYGAHLSVIAPGINRTVPAQYYAVGQTMVAQNFLDQAQAVAEENYTAISNWLRNAQVPWDIDDRVLQVVDLRAMLAQKIRYSDLLVIRRPDLEGHTDTTPTALEAALFDARVPLIMVPDTDAPLPEHRAAIGWNDSDEAMQAVRCALPILAEVAETEITIIDPPRHGADRSDPGGSLASFLTRHGATPEITVLARTEPSVAAIINRRIRETGAEILVLGAYSHTRLREAIFGGVTRTMLHSANVPILMAH